MAEPIIVKEYSKVEINDSYLDKLQAYLKCQKLESALKVTRHGIKTKSWVGVIKYKNLHLEILPKLISEDANNDKKISEEERSIILKNLIFMLSYTKNLDIKTNDNAKLSTEKNPFIEILIREFATSLFEALKRLTPKRYVREEENLNYLKGKIKFSENFRYNCTNQAKFYCEYDEFSENNLLNQLFLFVSTCLYNISNNSYNKKTLKFIINYYSDISFVRFDKFKVRKIKLTRNQELFKKSFNLAKMFVEQTSVDLSKNKFENITLVWDMNKLFEEFIFELIKRKIPECSPIAQKTKRLLRSTQETKRDTKVDILIQHPQIIIDTKYKKFTNFDDISSADIYQVTTYCLLHNYKRAILLYPQYDKKEPDICDYQLNCAENNYHIDFCTVNLKNNDLKDKEVQNSIIAKIKTIIGY
nr:MAG TPA: McrBC 5-methylcytosine restriction system component [Caudoviricetes sp.]